MRKSPSRLLYATKTPLTLSSQRQGLLLTLHTDDNKVGIGEISPLPTESVETIEEAQEELTATLPLFLDHPCDENLLFLLQSLSLFPSVYFGLEGALFSLLYPPSSFAVHEYVLLRGENVQELLSHAKRLFLEQKKEIKVKVGSFSFREAKLLLDTLFTFPFRIRLDFNRKWPKAQTQKLLSQYQNNTFLYAEEPAYKTEELFDFPYPFALDETLRDLLLADHKEPLLSLCSSPLCKAWIVKPTLSSPLTFLSEVDPKKIVITSSFESPTALHHLRRLIHKYNLIYTHHGLSPDPNFMEITS